MTDPIISPWIIYWITLIDKIKFFLVLFPIIFALSSNAIYFLKETAGDFADYEHGEADASQYLHKVLKYGLITIPLSIMLDIFIPDTKTLVTMYVADKFTISNVQMVGETADKVVDKAVEKVIKVIEVAKGEKNQ